MMDYNPPRGDTHPDSPWYKEPVEEIEDTFAFEEHRLKENEKEEKK